jgi:Glycosyltransferase family 87
VLSNKYTRFFPFVALFTVVGFILVWIYSTRNMNDYSNYYYGSKLLLEKKFDCTTYDPEIFNQYVVAHEDDPSFSNYTPVPPFSAFVWIPFTFALPILSKVIFACISLLIFAFAIRKLQDTMAAPSWSFMLALLVSLIYPLRSEIIAGQSYLLLISLLVGGYLASQEKKYWLAALLWALAIHLKIFPAIILIGLGAMREWKQLAYTIAATIVLFLFSLLFLPYAIWDNYLFHILPRLSAGEINDPWATSYQSLRVLLNQWLVHDDLLNPKTANYYPQLVKIISAIFTFIWLGIGILVSLHKKSNRYALFSSWIIIGLLISGYGTVYSLLLLFFPAFSFISDESISITRKRIFISLLFLICTLPLSLFEHGPFPIHFLRFFLVLIISMVYFSRFYPFRFHWGILAAIPFIVPAFFNSSIENNSRYFLKEEPKTALLNTELVPRDGKLNILFRSSNGYILGHTIAINGMIKPDSRLTIRENKLYFENKLILAGTDNKKQALLLNDTLAVYLSDQNRGVGFYTVRCISLKGK